MMIQCVGNGVRIRQIRDFQNAGWNARRILVRDGPNPCSPRSQHHSRGHGQVVPHSENMLSQMARPVMVCTSRHRRHFASHATRSVTRGKCCHTRQVLLHATSAVTRGKCCYTRQVLSYAASAVTRDKCCYTRKVLLHAGSAAPANRFQYRQSIRTIAPPTPIARSPKPPAKRRSKHLGDCAPPTRLIALKTTCATPCWGECQTTSSNGSRH